MEAQKNARKSRSLVWQRDLDRPRGGSSYARCGRAIAEEVILTQYHFAALVIAVVGPLLALARLTRIPDSLILLCVGFLSTFVPGLPPLQVDPDFVLTLFLPPLIYASAVRVSWHLLRFTFLPGVVLGTLLVLLTIGAVAWAVRTVLLPDLSWTAALLIGIAVSVFDTRLFHEAKGRPKVPRAIADTLKTRELVGRLVILATLSVVETSLASGRATIGSVVASYVFEIPAGILLGMAVGRAAIWARQRIDPAPVEIAVSVATPYAAALIAHVAGLSVVGAVTAAALMVSAIRVDSRSGATVSSNETRISAVAFWDEASLFASSVLFLLAGRAIPTTLSTLEAWPLWRLGLTAGALLGLVLAVQFSLSLIGVRLRPIAAALKRREGEPSHVAAAGVMAWSSTRSVIGLLVALSIPATLPDGSPFQERGLILVLATLVVVGSIVVQGLTLRRVVAWAGLADPAEQEREEETAHRAMQKAAAERSTATGSPHDAARQVLMRLREGNEIGDEVLVKMLRETDLHARTSEQDALPDAGPRNP